MADLEASHPGGGSNGLLAKVFGSGIGSPPTAQRAREISASYPDTKQNLTKRHFTTNHGTKKKRVSQSANPFYSNH
jgi:hypothetical protein